MVIFKIETDQDINKTLDNLESFFEDLKVDKRIVKQVEDADINEISISFKEWDINQTIDEQI